MIQRVPEGMGQIGPRFSNRYLNGQAHLRTCTGVQRGTGSPPANSSTSKLEREVECHIRLDHPLITALVERWRTETHTFHFPTGEATVTLQDVSVLYGLRIDGRAVTGLDPSLTTEQWIALCAELLGVAPTLADLQAGRVRVRWLSEHFQGDFPDDAADELVQQHARAYILWLIGGVLLLDKSQNLLKLMYLPLLRDIDVIGQYSWGAAALACLYRMLCRATQVGVTQIGGPLVLLQIWAWERLIRIAPSRRQVVAPGKVPISQGDMQLPAGPRGSRWRVDMGHEVVSTHVVVVYRDQLDRMIEGEVWYFSYICWDRMSKQQIGTGHRVGAL
ncbi:serine/threonine-protein phosphatase 7 long form homolog [Camellia sinensis]|uniref:serine/threonine-protein phosphatase 7 long form homolog n=1 Tax=Camellia sinensis TaxID=4442 RepID=UPI0010360561|nr:serine/threonine-protein phosphatase 7 long form homolog [Camellia sinensis]